MLTGCGGAHMYTLSGSGDCLAVGTCFTGTSCSTAPVNWSMTGAKC